MKGKAIMKVKGEPVMLIDNDTAIRIADLPNGKHIAQDGSYCIVARKKATTEIHYHKGVKQ